MGKASWGEQVSEQRLDRASRGGSTVLRSSARSARGRWLLDRPHCIGASSGCAGFLLTLIAIRLVPSRFEELRGDLLAIFQVIDGGSATGDTEGIAVCTKYAGSGEQLDLGLPSSSIQHFLRLVEGKSFHVGVQVISIAPCFRS